MAPSSNLPKLLRPVHAPQGPDHHDHTGHSHPHPRPSPYITSIAMALLSTYVLLLVSLALFTMWRVSRKHSQLGGMTGATRNDAGLRFGGGAGGVQRAGWQQKVMAKSGVVVREVDGSGMGTGSRIPNTHLSHEDLDDTEETALLASDGYTDQSCGMAKPRELERYDENMS